MKKKMPQSSKTHVYDKRARKNLEAFFPEHWKWAKQHDDDSGIEYGEDWIIQVTDDQNQLTGAKFYIQSKSTEKPIRRRRIGMKLKVSTLNYLHSLTMPVILHYHHAPSDTGYWMWFDEFYDKEYTPAWERKKEIMVYIPTKNVLDAKAVKQIKANVIRFHRRQLLQKQAETTSKGHPHFSFRFEATEDYMGIDVLAKHAKALEENPIEIDLSLQVDTELNMN